MQPLSFCVFGRRQLFHVQLKPAELSSLKVDFIEKSQQGQMRRQGKFAIARRNWYGDYGDPTTFLGFVLTNGLQLVFN